MHICAYTPYYPGVGHCVVYYRKVLSEPLFNKRKKTPHFLFVHILKLLNDKSMKRLFPILVFVAMLLAACSTDTTQDVAVEIPDTIEVSFEGNSRIQLSEGKTVWTQNDLVSVFYRSNANQQWKFQGNTGDRSGILKRVATPDATKTLSNIVAVYPYSENYYINPESCNVEAMLPAEQTYMKDSYGIDGNIMVSASEFNQLYLRNVLGWLKIQLKGEGQVVKKITLKGNNGEQVAGLVYINSADATAILASEHSAGGEDGVGCTLVLDDTILTEVTLNCPDGVTLGAEPTAFYIALPPQKFNKGFTLKVLYDDDTTMTKSTSHNITIERNTILPMDALYYDGNTPPVYELVYKTNDGEPLDPYITEGFGANFVENLYDATTGCGSLVFDGRITTIPEKAFIVCGNLTNIVLTSDITSIGAEAFSTCTNLAIVNIPQGVKSIGNKVFYNCTGVQEITIPSSVSSIGNSSFDGCGGKAIINCKIYSSYFGSAKFTEVVIGDNVTSIGKYAFYDCSSLTSVTIGNSVTSIGNTAFCGCSTIKDVYYTGDLSAWCKISFADGQSNPMYYGAKLYIDNMEVTEVTIPSNITEIKDYAFRGCTSITSVTIGNRVTSIGYDAFSNCNSLKDVYYAGDLSAWCKISFASFGSNPMDNGAKLYIDNMEVTEVTIPSNITEIKDYAFCGCTSITSVTIGNRVTSIGYNAFSNCNSLKDVYYAGDLSGWCMISFKDPNSNPMKNGAKFYIDNMEVTEVTIPSNITEIKDYAFRGCTSITSVTIGNRVTSIGYDAFRKCSSLTSVTIPTSVMEIKEKVFYDCSSLKEVYCKSIAPPVLGSKSFHNNATDRKIYVQASDNDRIINAYKTAAVWSDYATDIEEYTYTD